MRPTDFPPDQPTTARLPFWNEHAYAVFPKRSDGPWVDVYDVLHGVGGGDPVKVLITDCDRDDWEVVGPKEQEA